MDRLDRLSLGAIVLLIVGAGALVAGHAGEARPRHQAQAADMAPAPPGEIEGGVKLARNLLEAGNPDKAETLMNDLSKRYPYEAAPRMLLGDIAMRRQDPVRAVREYREAVELDPDYLDRKTPLFQGKKLRVAVGEALAEIDKRLRLHPDDASLRQERKGIHYLQRRIAGSCS